MRTAASIDLAGLPPGPELSAALAAVELSGVPNDRLLELLAAQHRQLCHEQARMVAVLAEVGRATGFPEPGEVSRLAAPERYASEETRAALRWTRRAAEWEHELAETVVHGMPALHAAWLAGAVDRPRAGVFDRYLTGLAPEQVAAICAKAVPLAPTRTTGQLAVLLRRMVLAVDPAAAERWYRKGIRERNVTAVMGHDGTVTMSANGLPADEAEAACVRVQDLAAAAKRAGHPGLIGQIRCDLFLGLLDGRFHGMTTEQVVATLIAQYGPDGPGSLVTPPEGSSPSPRHGMAPSTAGLSITGAGDGGGPAGGQAADVAPDRPRAGGGQGGIEVRVALSTLLGRDEQPGEIPGLGLLPAPAARARVALQRRAEWRFAVTDTDGHLVSEGVTRRRPGRVGSFPVGRHGVPGGIVEIHVPAVLLDELVAGGREVSGEWAGVIADVAAQHARRDEHVAGLDARPADRLPTAALRRHTEIRDRTCVFPGCRRRAHTAEADHTRDHAPGGPRSPRTSVPHARTTTTSSTAAAGDSNNPNQACSSGTAHSAGGIAPVVSSCCPPCPSPAPPNPGRTTTGPQRRWRARSCSPTARCRSPAHRPRPATPRRTAVLIDVSTSSPAPMRTPTWCRHDGRAVHMTARAHQVLADVRPAEHSTVHPWFVRQ